MLGVVAADKVARQEVRRERERIIIGDGVVEPVEEAFSERGKGMEIRSEKGIRLYSETANVEIENDGYINNSTIMSILKKEKLTGLNFTSWYRNLRIVLMAEKKLAHLEQPLMPTPLPVARVDVRDAYHACYLFGSISYKQETRVLRLIVEVKN
ncbi:hypothetical protein Tco_0341726 [Tanacetum coccineum]